MLVNLTPHPIVLRLPDESEIVIPPSGEVARVAIATPNAPPSLTPATLTEVGAASGNLMPLAHPAEAMAALATDAMRTLREVQQRAARMIATGDGHPLLPVIASIVAVEGPTCPRCRCALVGTPPTICPGCGASVAWSITTRILP